MSSRKEVSKFISESVTPNGVYGKGTTGLFPPYPNEVLEE